MKMDMLNLCDELRKKLYLWSQEKFWPILEENKQLKEENEQLKEDVKRYRNQASRLRNKNNRLSELLKGNSGLTIEEEKPIYAVYDLRKNEKLVAIGTIQECSELLGISVGHLRLCGCPSGQKRNFKYKTVKLGKLD
jgi:flagellar motor switch/type III secretory pathway protein FliN